jgi:hypothetical protein
MRAYNQIPISTCTFFTVRTSMEANVCCEGSQAAGVSNCQFTVPLGEKQVILPFEIKNIEFTSPLKDMAIGFAASFFLLSRFDSEIPRVFQKAKCFVSLKTTFPVQ